MSARGTSKGLVLRSSFSDNVIDELISQKTNKIKIKIKK
jgi:hypothetical protein